MSLQGFSESFVKIFGSLFKNKCSILTQNGFFKNAWNNPLEALFYLMHKEIGWICSCNLIPFEAEYLSSDSKIPTLKAAKGARRVVALTLQISIVLRVMLIFSVGEGKLQMVYNGNLTVDFCFAAANALMGLAIAFAWVRLWLNLDYFAWTYNTMNQVSRDLAERHLGRESVFLSSYSSRLIFWGLFFLISSSVWLLLLGFVAPMFHNYSSLYLDSILCKLSSCGKVSDFVYVVAKVPDAVMWVTIVGGNVFLCGCFINFGGFLCLMLKALTGSTGISTGKRMLYHTQLAVIINSMDSILGWLIPFLLFSLFMAALAFNAMLFLFIPRMENQYLWLNWVFSSLCMIFIGFCFLQIAEGIKTMSVTMMKDMEASMEFYALRRDRLRRLVCVTKPKCRVRATFKARRLIGKPLALRVGGFGTIDSGDSVSWMQQVIDNTVTAIFTVSVGDKRLLL